MGNSSSSQEAWGIFCLLRITELFSVFGSFVMCSLLCPEHMTVENPWELNSVCFITGSYTAKFSLLLPREWFHVLLCQAGQFSAFLFALGEWCDEVMNANLLLQFRDLSYLSQNPDFRTSVSSLCLKIFKPQIAVITLFRALAGQQKGLTSNLISHKRKLSSCLKLLCFYVLTVMETVKSIWTKRNIKNPKLLLNPPPACSSFCQNYSFNSFCCS